MTTRWLTLRRITVHALGPLLLALTVACQSPSGGTPPVSNPASAPTPEASAPHAHDAGGAGAAHAHEARPAEISRPSAPLPDDVRAQSADYIRSYFTIKLTPEQERIKRQALEGIPAPCCSNYSIATCCCPCNLAKAAWGLSHRLIAESGYDAPAVREAVDAWLKSVNPDGYQGDACYTPGGCNRPFNQDGCGGMGGEIIAG